MSKVHVGTANYSVVVGGSVNKSKISSAVLKRENGIFVELEKAIMKVDNDDVRSSLQEIRLEMEKSAGTSEFVFHYKNFCSAAADHVTLLSPFLVGLSQLLI